jgi:hypothetical protein
MRLEMVNNCCAMARRLIADGVDSDEVLEFCRGDVVCLRGKAGDFARLQVQENERMGPRFIRWRELPPLIGFKSTRFGTR